MDLDSFIHKLEQKMPLTEILTHEDYCKPDGIAYGIAGFIKMTQLRAFFQPIDDLYKTFSNNDLDDIIEAEHIDKLLAVIPVLINRVERKVISKEFGNLMVKIIDKDVLKKYKDFFCFYKLLTTVICYHPYRHKT